MSSDLHTRQMNLNAHFAWALAMWASAEAAHKRENTMLAAIGYYYSAFHAGFAVVNTSLTIPVEKLVRITHSALRDYLDPLLPPMSMLHFVLLQEIREAINYLGATSPESKLRIVRGHGFGFDLGDTQITFTRGLEMAHKQSLQFLGLCLSVLEEFCAKEGIVGPKRGDAYWASEHLDDDVLLHVIPRNGDGNAILQRAFTLLSGDLNHSSHTS